ncbi:hypothetical protein [Streptomyces sp. NPDC001056]
MITSSKARHPSVSGAKKVPDRGRGPAVDMAGLVIAVAVLTASVHDNAPRDRPRGAWSA